MHLRAIFHLVSYTMLLIGAAMGISGFVSLAHPDPAHARIALFGASLITFGAAGLLWWRTRGPIELSRRDGFGIATFGWLLAAAFGALPYLLDGNIAHPAAALFESMSGFTTTGASVIAHPESLPRGMLFWRSLTQWLGGMGVLVLCVAVLPFIGVGGMQLYRAEMPGPTKDRLAPRIASTAKVLWLIYLVLSLGEAVALRLAGMNWFDAVCHTFTTMSTGGFSTRDASIAAFDSAAIELVIVVFMLVAGINFSLHFRAATGRPGVYFNDPECRYFIGGWAAATCIVAAILRTTTHTPLADALRKAVFQVTSIVTTTGYATDDYDEWAIQARFVLVLLMFMGGCAGSTAGSIKVVRLTISVKKIFREIQLFMMPNAVVQVRFGPNVVPASIVMQISAFVLVFFFLFGTASFLMSMYTPDFQTACSSVIATLGNVGPGLGAAGPTDNYAGFAPPAQLMLVLLMLLGRLELYTVLVILTPGFWKQ